MEKISERRYRIGGKDFIFESSKEVIGTQDVLYQDGLYYEHPIYSSEQVNLTLNKDELIIVSVIPLLDPIIANASDADNLWWFNDSDAGGATDYGTQGDTLDDQGSGATISNFDACHPSFDNCGLTNGANHDFTSTGSILTDNKNQTIAIFFKPVTDEGNFDFYGGDNDAMWFAESGDSIRASVRDSSGFGNADLITDYTSRLNQSWYFLWAEHRENATGWFVCGYINYSHSTQVCDAMTNGLYQGESVFEAGARANSGETVAYFQYMGAWDRLLNESEKSCVYNQTIAGNKTFECFSEEEVTPTNTTKNIIKSCHATPFCTESTNPFNLTFTSDGSYIVNLTQVNATGEINSTWEFFVNATVYDDPTVSKETPKINITIIAAEAGCCTTNTWDCDTGGSVAGYDAGGNKLIIEGDNKIIVSDDLTNCNKAGERIKRIGSCEVVWQGSKCET
jgi:hypothetical protein